MSLITPELSLKIADWRLRAAEGTLTLDETKEFITILRQGRMSAGAAAQTAAKTRKKAIAAIPSADDMLSDLEGL